MGTIAKPNSFTANTTASASQVNANFDTIYNEFNGNISAANLATDAVTTAKIADSNVTTAKIADSNVTTAKIADANITPAKLLAGTGTDWVWDSWTPTWTNLTISSSTVDCKYIQIGKTVIARGHITLAGSPSVGTNAYFSLPVAENTGYATSADFYTPIGTAYYLDASANVYVTGTINIGVSSGAGVGFLAIDDVSATYGTFRGTTSAIPFTWAAGDIITFSITYEAA